MSLRLLVAGFLIVVVVRALPVHVRAQAPPSGQANQESGDEKEKARREVERKALSLLNETLDAAQNLKLVENRALIETTGADLLWTRDEKRARALFRTAIMDLGASLDNLAARTTARDQNYWTLYQIRMQSLEMLLRRDPKLALELLRATRLPGPDQGGNGVSRVFVQEASLEDRIAGQMAANDPAQAVKMAEENLSRGLSFGLLGVLWNIQQKDADAASRLARDIVKQLHNEPANEGPQTFFFAANLLRMTLATPQGAQLSASNQPRNTRPLALDEDTERDLAALAINLALGMPPENSSLAIQLQPLLPELEKRAPERIAQLRQRIDDATISANPQAAAQAQFHTLLRNGTPDAILDAASKAPPGVRADYYSEAAMWFAGQGKLDEARQAADLSGPHRDQVLKSLERLALERDIQKGKLDEARQSVLGIRDSHERAAALARLGISFASRKDLKSALALLDEARAMVALPPENERDVNALLEIANGYAMAAPPRAFEIIEPLIDSANQIIAAAEILERFGSNRGTFKKGEMVLGSALVISGGVGSNYLGALAALARVDFDRTRTAADRFQRPELRLMARLTIAKSILSTTPAGVNPNEEVTVVGGGGGTNVVVINQ